MTRQNQLLAFIQSGPNCTRRWKECADFYVQVYGGCHKGCRAFSDRAMDYALFRLEKAGLTKNIARGLHQAA